MSDTDQPRTPAEARAATFSDVYFHLGWSRQLPNAAIAILSPLVTEGPLTVDELEEHLRPEAGADRGWQSPAWEPLHEWTDEELRTLDEEFANGPFAEDEPADARAVMADEAHRRSEHLAEADAYSRALGVAEVRTLGQLLEFMVACGVLERRRVGAREVIELNARAPLPGEVLPLSEERQAEEDALRWRDLHERAAQGIIRLFDPDGAQREQLRTSLERLARDLDVDVETARGGVQNLLAEGDFTANADLARLSGHQVFELSVDWERFVRSRFGIRIATPEDDDGPV